MKIIYKNLWMLAVALAAFAPVNAYALSAIAQQVQGEVMLQKAGSTDWAPITSDTPLQTGDSLKTNAGSCVLAYTDQATFNLESNTTLTVEERADAQDIKLLLGKIKGKVNKLNAQQPFVVTTPAAVATVRGTDVDFAFNDQGELTVDLHTGAIQVVNSDAEMSLDLGGKKSIKVKYDKDANILYVKNNCESDGPISFQALGSLVTQNPCEEKQVDLSTAEEGTSTPDTLGDDPDNLENPDDLREPQSEFNT